MTSLSPVSGEITGNKREKEREKEREYEIDKLNVERKEINKSVINQVIEKKKKIKRISESKLNKENIDKRSFGNLRKNSS